MYWKKEIHTSFKSNQKDIDTIISHFDTVGINYGNQNRNAFKLVDFNHEKMNIKSFKKPHLLNRFIYKYLRLSKAERSFIYAHKLLSLGIKTPQPIAFYIEQNLFGINRSYYLSKHFDYDFTFRELTQEQKLPNHHQIIKEFVKFTYDLHEKGIEFLDHSPGNTLIKKNASNTYDFYLVDLNRMNFTTLDFHQRMKNLCRLTDIPELIHEIAVHYSELSQIPEKQIEDTINKYVCHFQNQIKTKRKLKKKLKFWKK